MVQIFPERQSIKSRLAEMMGTSVSQGIARNFPTPESRVQKGMLEDAFKKLETAPEGDYLAQLKAIAPSLLSTPGGAEALSGLAPILAQQSKNKSIVQSVKEARDKAQEARTGNKEKEPALKIEKTPQQEQEKYQPTQFNESQNQPENTLFPESSTNRKVQQLMSPDEVEDLTYQIMENSGGTVDYGKAAELAQQRNQNIFQNNQIIEGEKAREAKAIEDLNADVVSRAINSGLISSDDPESKTVAEKLGHQARNLGDPVKRWEKVKEGLTEYNTAKNHIKRESDLPGPFANIARRIIGTYKDKETVMRDIQPYLDIYRKYGLIDQARAALTNELGFGPEDTETSLFPFSKEQKTSIDKFPINEKKVGFGREAEFPSNQFNLPPEKFEGFKEELAKILNENKGINLISLRGRLNQDKKYSWQDISKGISELRSEKRFKTDPIQFQQLGVIGQAPLPGLTEQFKNLWTGKK